MYIMTSKDEDYFLELLRKRNNVFPICFDIENGNISMRILERLSEPDKDYGECYLWNEAFPFVPEFARSSDGTVFSFPATNSMPVIEFISRKNIPRGGQMYGRVYWKHYDPLQYDEKAFAKWYDSVVRIVRKYAAYSYGEAYKTYVFPDAYEKYKDEFSNMERSNNN